MLAHCIRLLFVILIAVGAGGCRRGPAYGPLVDVSGTVTVDGSLLDDGTAAFVTPASGDVQVFAVRDGRFAGQARVGLRRVEFRRYAPPKPNRSDSDLPGPDPFPANTLPDHLNSMSAITVTIAADGRNEFAFELLTSPPNGAQ